MGEMHGDYPGLQPAQNAGGMFEPCPQINSSEVEGGAQLSRREFGKKLGMIVAGGMLVMSVGGKLAYEAQSFYSKERWQPNNPEILPAFGSEKIPPGGSEYLLFLGYGQYDGRNASRELFEAMGQDKATWWMRCPSQGYSPQDLAPEILKYITQRNPSELNLVGVSMGTIVALESIRSAAMLNNRNRGPNPGGTKPEPVVMPKINYLVAYSSPGDIEDAMQGELANLVVATADKIGYTGDYAGKFLYTMSDKLAKGQVDLSSSEGWVRSFVDSVVIANDNCPPKLCMSQLAILSRFNILSQAERYQDVLDPGLKFVYISAASDNIVRDAESDKAYVSGLKSIGVTNFESLSTDQDHANTAASAEAFGRWVAERATSTTTLLAAQIPPNY